MEDPPGVDVYDTSTFHTCDGELESVFLDRGLHLEYRHDRPHVRIVVGSPVRLYIFGPDDEGFGVRDLMVELRSTMAFVLPIIVLDLAGEGGEVELRLHGGSSGLDDFLALFTDVPRFTLIDEGLLCPPFRCFCGETVGFEVPHRHPRHSAKKA